MVCNSRRPLSFAFLCFHGHLYRPCRERKKRLLRSCGGQSNRQCVSFAAGTCTGRTRRRSVHRDAQRRWEVVWLGLHGGRVVRIWLWCMGYWRREPYEILVDICWNWRRHRGSRVGVWTRGTIKIGSLRVVHLCIRVGIHRRRCRKCGWMYNLNR